MGEGSKCFQLSMNYLLIFLYPIVKGLWLRKFGGRGMEAPVPLTLSLTVRKILNGF